jgi:hypothetical protein
MKPFVKGERVVFSTLKNDKTTKFRGTFVSSENSKATVKLLDGKTTSVSLAKLNRPRGRKPSGA